MELTDEEKKSLYKLLRQNDKSLDKILYSMKYRLEKELFGKLTIEEIQEIESGKG